MAQKGSERVSLRHLASDRRILAMLGLGFSSGMPFLLVYVTQSAWLSEAKVPITTLGLMSELTLAYKFLWAPFERLGFEWFFVATSLIGVPVVVSCWYVQRLQERTKPQPAF